MMIFLKVGEMRTTVNTTMDPLGMDLRATYSMSKLMMRRSVGRNSKIASEYPRA